MARGRKAGIRYYASKGGYFAVIRGVRHRLATGPDDYPVGPTYRKAQDEFQRLTDLAAAPQLQQSNTLEAIIHLYLSYLEPRAKKRTIHIRKSVLSVFAETFGRVTIQNLTKHAVYEWQQKVMKTRKGKRRQTTWTASTVATAAEAISACLNWASEAGLIKSNPLAGMHRPTKPSRGREAEITEEEHRKIIAISPEGFANVCRVLYLTGARPNEIVAATANAFDPVRGTITYHPEETRKATEHQHKTSGKARTRTVILTGEALSIVRQLAEKHPTGCLFRSSRGIPWTIETLCNTARYYGHKAGVMQFTLYSYRHTLATNFLLAGGSIDILAGILGNSPAVIRRHYSHALEHTDELREALESFQSLRGKQDTSTPVMRVYHDGAATGEAI